MYIFFFSDEQLGFLEKEVQLFFSFRVRRLNLGKLVNNWKSGFDYDRENSS